MDHASRIPTLVLGAVAAVVVVLDTLAARSVIRQADLSPQQRWSQFLFIWVLPVVGAWIALEINRPWRRPLIRRPGLAADEINPIVDQALRPLANAEMRAAERYIDNELADFGHDASSASHDAGPSHD